MPAGAQTAVRDVCFHFRRQQQERYSRCGKNNLDDDGVNYTTQFAVYTVHSLIKFSYFFKDINSLMNASLGVYFVIVHLAKDFNVRYNISRLT